MIVERFFTPGLAEVAYLVADESTRQAAVIDPRRDVDVYLEWLNVHAFDLVAILETHVHADFVSGARELQHRTGAPIFASRLGQQEFPHRPLDDGDTVAVGDLILQALWTPGHTPEHMAYRLIDPAVRPEPVALFSGDLLFVGEVGRPDLLGAAATADLATQLFTTLTTRLDHLQDDVVVYPGHTAGSSCGRKIGEAPQTTMGIERQGNYALQFDDRDAFVEAIMTRMPTPPAYYPRMKMVNKAGPILLDELDAGSALTLAHVDRLLAEGAVIIDAREERAFDAGHIPGSYYAGDTADFVNWAGWLAPYDRQIVLVLDRDDAFGAFATELYRIGLDSIAGYLEGGFETWTAACRPASTLAGLSPDQLRRSLDSGEPVRIVDVRTEAEWSEGHIAGAANTFAGDIVKGSETAPDVSGMLLLACASGYRSRVAASMLKARGVTNVVQLDGGMDAWQDLGYPVEAA
ncbi:MAG: MBL fold metallo-hydrolase [Thermomicrobiales bacterium]|nr:MBL fold metallo-hydrolase [Thermomicrobiales bacterium]